MNAQRTIHNVQQGSAAWLALRAGYFTASEAPAMMGVSKHLTRSQLLHQKHAGIAPEVDPITQALFDRGHASEAAARPIAEGLVGQDLYPITATLEIDGLQLLASLDGLTMGEDIAWETKLWNEELAADVLAGTLSDHYTVQMDQELLVSGASRCLFTCSDGTPGRTVSRWYETTQEKQDALIAGWKQFAADLAAYTPPEVVEKVSAEVVADLPAVAVRMDGALVVHSNLDAFRVALHAYIDRIPRKPSTDQEFAEAEAAVKTLQKAEDALDAAESGALASITDVNEMQRAAGVLRELARSTRLALDKAVKARKEQIRDEIVRDARTAFGRHVDALQAELEGVTLPLAYPDFAGAIKGKRTIVSLRDAVDTLMAQSKIAANEAAQRIRASLAVFNAEASEHMFLFADRVQLVQKPAEDVRTLVQARIAKHQADEAARLEAERERIRAEEQARAQREAAAEAARVEAERIAAWKDEQDREDARRRALWLEAEAAKPAVPIPMQVAPVTPSSQPSGGDEPVVCLLTGELFTPPTAADPVARHIGTHPAFAQERSAEPATLKLGTICERLGFTLTAAFVADTLGIQPTPSSGRAVLFKESDFARICKALVKHIEWASGTVEA